ncbi:hypothetical protein HYQ45_005201 [Verticillium longisporum]|uniref:Secreted protein n=1 Tax=Verticillium longisporum TaxID=100787 RepID=A0A8I3ASP7_VERLO|nr:hypothetical protein HYQ45_005201 [Verticillium longisporum]
MARSILCSLRVLARGIAWFPTETVARASRSRGVRCFPLLVGLSYVSSNLDGWVATTTWEPTGYSHVQSNKPPW